MALYVRTNVTSLNAQRHLANSNKVLEQAYQRLASGLRINSASDDAAGMQISNRLASQIQGLTQGNRNANDGISLAQTAEGAMDEITTLLQRMRTLAEQSANGSNSANDRVSLQQEVSQLSAEINRIAKSTTFAGRNLLDGSYSATFQVGAKANQTIALNISTVWGLNGDVTINGGFTLSGMAGVASAVTGRTLGSSGFLQGATAVSVTSLARAQAVLADVDALMTVVGRKRSELGAIQNRFESTIRNQENMIENLSESRSRIRDADFAAETAQLTLSQTLRMAATTVLTQANRAPSIALLLLQ